MSNRHTVVPRTMCFVFHKDEVLLLRASEHKEWTGMYDPVGGHIEKGEHIIESAKREIWEETGLEVEDMELKGIVHVTGFFGKNVMMFVLACTSSTKEVVSNEEGELEWVKKDDLHNVHAFDDLHPILDKVLNMQEGKIFIGTSVFDGKHGLEKLDVSYMQ